MKDFLINPIFLQENKLRDKHYQEFKIFLNKKKVKNIIKKERIFCKINTEEIMDIIADCKVVYLKEGIRSQKFIKLWNKIEKYYIELKKTVESLLELFRQPRTWHDSFFWFFISKKINFYRKEVVSLHLRGNKIILEISSEATARDFREAWKYVKELQVELPGNKIKSKHKVAIKQENLDKAKDWGSYQKHKKQKPKKELDYATGKHVQPPDMKRMELVDRYDEGAFDNPKKRKRTLANVRKNAQRYKK